LEAAQSAQAAGADMIGFVFAASKRSIEPEQAATISKAVPVVAKVGVFVDESAEVVNQIADLCDLDYVQLHGQESLVYCRQIKRPIIKAFQVTKQCGYQQINEFKVDYALLDSYIPGQNGGTGIAFNWHEAKETCYKISLPVIVAGGLTAENVQEAILTLNPAGVDVSGGVETNGVKDTAKIRQFIQAARAAQRGCQSAQ
jgi:phosphoribosylanthranilate isomerase